VPVIEMLNATASQCPSPNTGTVVDGYDTFRDSLDTNNRGYDAILQYIRRKFENMQVDPKQKVARVGEFQIPTGRHHHWTIRQSSRENVRKE
jgi:hypothetical protein